MDSLAKILGDKDFREPPEIRRLKSFIADQYGADCIIRLSRGDLVVSVKSASLANALRLNGPDIMRQLNLKRQLRFNVG